MAKLKSILIKIAELSLEFAALFVAVFLMAGLFVYESVILGLYKKIGGRNVKR